MALGGHLVSGWVVGENSSEKKLARCFGKKRIFFYDVFATFLGFTVYLNYVWITIQFQCGVFYYAYARVVR